MMMRSDVAYIDKQCSVVTAFRRSLIQKAGENSKDVSM